MRWLRVKFEAWGAFEGQELSLDSPSPGLHIIHGANEAGKSTAMRGLRSLLYGIPARTTDAFKHTYNELKLSAEIERGDGAQWAFSRRKGTKNTLIDAEAKAVPESMLEAFLGGVSAEVYERVFSMDHPSLVAGGQALASGGGSAQEILFQAGAGMTHLRKVMRALDEEAAALYKETGTRSVVNQALSQAKAATKRVAECSVRPREWVKMEEQRQTLSVDRDQLVQKLAEMDRRRRELEQIRQALPLVQTRAGIVAELQEMGAITLLDEGASDERVELERDEERARLDAESAQRRLTALEEELATIQIPEGLVAAGATIRRLVERLDRYRSAVGDVPKREAEVKQHEREALRRLNELRPGLGLEGAGEFRLSSADRTAIERLAEEAGLLEHARTVLEERRKKLKARELKIQDGEGESSDGPESDLGSLELMVRRLERRGDLDGEIRKLGTEATSLENQLERTLQRLGRWSGSLEGLVGLPLPDLETVGGFEDRYADMAQRQRELETQFASIEEERVRTEGELTKVRKSSAAPTEDELEQARHVRDAQWKSLRQKSESGEPWESGAPDDYESAVESADTVADRLRRDARQVEQLALLEDRLKTCSDEGAEAQKRLGASKGEQTSLEKEWMDLWSPMAVDTATPKLMRAWLVSVGELRREVEVLLRMKEQRRAFEEERQEAETELSNVLRNHGVGFPKEAAFGDLLVLARRRMDELNEGARKRAERTAEARRVSAELDEVAGELKGQGERDAEWKKAWARAVKKAGLDPETSVEEMRAAMEAWSRFWAEVDLRERALVAVEDLKQVMRGFERDVDDVRGLADDADQKLSAEILVSRLDERLRKAEGEVQQRALLNQRVKDERAHYEKAKEQAVELGARLKGLMERAGCEDRDGLLKAEVISARHRDITGSLAEVETALRRLHPTETMEVFAERVQEWDEVRIEQALAEVSPQVQDLSDRRVETERELAVVEKQMQEKDGSDAAATAREEAESFTAVAEEGAERHARLRLAEFFLRRHLDQYMERNQGPVLRVGSEIFERLTLGRYSKIVPDFNEKDDPILKAVRENGDAVTVEGLSDGTRDQMFLALRLASLEQRLEGGQVFPLIVDDLLLTFDNERATAALRELARLSNQTQVLFFTHHSHLVELAQKALKPSEIRVLELGV